MYRLITLFFILALTGGCRADQPVDSKTELLIYDVPKAALYTHHNDDYTVRVRVPGGEWQDLYEYNVKVDLDKPQDASLVYFDFSGSVEVAIKKNNGDISRVEIRPKSALLESKIHKDTSVVTFTLRDAANLSVEFNGDRLHNLHLFANAIEKQLPSASNPDVIWFGPGVHKPPEGSEGSEGRFVIPSNKTVYIAGGALVKGIIDIQDAENVKVLGHGIIDNAGRGFELERAKNVTIDGPIILNPKHYTIFCGQSNHITINNIKSFSASPWSDGIDMMSCSDVTINNVFLRTSDDAIAIYGHRWDFYGDSRNIHVSNSTLWTDIAHPINIGLHGNDKNPEVIENITFKNIDILGHDEDDRNYQGVMAISNGDDNLVRNVVFEDIRIEDIQEGMLFNIRVVYNKKYGLSPGRGVRDVSFKDISFSGDYDYVNRPIISGYSEQRMVENITFDNVTIGNKTLSRKDIDIGEFVRGITFK